MMRGRSPLPGVQNAAEYQTRGTRDKQADELNVIAKSSCANWSVVSLLYVNILQPHRPERETEEADQMQWHSTMKLHLMAHHGIPSTGQTSDGASEEDFLL